MISKRLFAIFVCVFLIALIGCSNQGSESSEAEPIDENEQVQEESNIMVSLENWDQVVVEAEREGRIVVAGPPVPSHRETIMKFEEAYPEIKVEYTGMTPADFEARVSSERDNKQYLWDVYISGVSSTVYSQQIANGWYDSIKDVIVQPGVLDDNNWLGGFESSFLDTEGKYVFAFGGAIKDSIFVNRDMVAEEEFNNYEDLLDPKWAGQIALSDPRIRGGGSNSFRQIFTILGEEKSREFLREQDYVMTDTPRQVAEWGVRGTYPILISLDSALIRDFEAQGIEHNLQPIPDPSQSILTQWGNVLLLNNAPNPNASAVFVNWLLSQEAQADWAERGAVNSRRLDVEPGDLDIYINDESVWLEGYNLSSQETAEEAVTAMEVAREEIQ